MEPAADRCTIQHDHLPQIHEHRTNLSIAAVVGEPDAAAQVFSGSIRQGAVAKRTDALAHVSVEAGPC
jgi:hypothetical protein